ncbi:phage holin family protein [Paenibacillus sp. LHD-117]|uniref:phage holin family protein n=1 Tax=Paenibacillus sp. LHD-117 TaxID=3071412 RepID=UPI0027E1D5FE|nr:phage holin family protein [Paenibacillus sp. LHD-117]MDQ6418664.1 phage holin family protein [Paenibacillus sp. LHD-117]
MSKGQAVWSGVGAVMLPVIEFFYGAGESVIAAIIALAFFILLDWISGSRAAQKDNSYGSKYGIDGLFRTFFMLLLPAGGHFLDVLFNLPGLLFGLLVAGLLYHVIQSMTANAVRAGWADWLPINALEAITKWVGSELDKKVQRSINRGGIPSDLKKADESNVL